MQEFAGNATGLYYTTDEAHEGSRAFLEKRRPDFSSVPAPPVTEPAATVAPARPSTFRIWLLAIRPATLPAALSGVVVGLGAALAVGTPFRLDAALGCLAVALLLQITANLSNDLSDFRKGADTPARTGPIRVAAAGLVTERQLEIAIALTIVLAGIVGLGLTVIGGPILLVIGVLAVVAALAYTGGPWPYGYRGLGEVFVFVFFGLVAVAGTAYLQAGRLDPLFVGRGDPGRGADDGDPRGQQPARHPDRYAGRQADAGGRARGPGDADRIRRAPVRRVPGAGRARRDRPRAAGAAAARSRCRWRRRSCAPSGRSASRASSTWSSRARPGSRSCSGCCSRSGWPSAAIRL